MSRYVRKPYDPMTRAEHRRGRPANSPANLRKRIEKYLVKHHPSRCMGCEHALMLRYDDVEEMVNDYVDIRRIKRNVQREIDSKRGE